MKLSLKGIPVAKRAQLNEKTNRTYYSLSVAQDGEIIDFACNDIIYDQCVLYESSDFIVELTKVEFQGKVYERKQVVDFG